jgi:hypothetical protein
LPFEVPINDNPDDASTKFVKIIDVGRQLFRGAFDMGKDLRL